MLKNRIWLGIILSIILLVFSINGFTSYYKYTQESGANFYVGIADKADALEDTNEMRQIIDDLGALVVHSKRDDAYPKNGLFGGTIQIPEAGLKFSNDPVNDDIAAYIAGEMAWQTKAELGIDLSLYYLKTEIDTLSEVETIYTKNITDSDELATALTDYYLKTAIDTIGEVEAIWVKDIIDSDELAALKFTDLDDTPAAYDNGKYAKSTVDGVVWDTPTGGYTNLTSFVDQTAWRLFYSNADGDVTELVFGTDGQYLKSTGATSVPEFDTPTGAGDMLKATYDSDEDDEIDVAGGGTEKASWTQYCIPYLSNTTVFGEIPIGTAEYALTVNAGENGYDWTLFDLSLYYLKTEINTQAKVETIWGVSLANDSELHTILTLGTASGLSLDAQELSLAVADTDTTGALNDTDWDTFNNKEPALTDEASLYNTLSDVTEFIEAGDAIIKNYYSALGSDHTYSDNADVDSQPVGESVVFGQSLYFNWTDKEWKLTDADAAATMPGLRIALETKSDGQTCLMLVKGYIRDDDAFEFAGSMVYASVTPGAMSSTAPTETGDQLQRVGVAKSADILFFDPSIDVGEI